MHVLVVTTVHIPVDARILHRQVRSLVEAGHRVTMAAAWSTRQVEPPPSVTAVDLPRAAGRRRVAALRAAVRLLRRPPAGVDLVLLHDPELLLAAAVARPAVPVVWDVHEDLAASMTDKSWIPKAAVRPLRSAVRRCEGWAERRFHLLLAEEAYGSRFNRRHPVVLNLPWARPLTAGQLVPRAVYVGRLSRTRGALDLVTAGERLARQGVGLDLIGPADTDVRANLEAATAAGSVVWHGPLPNPRALALVEGALAGLSLLHAAPNYWHSMPTKVLEYLERGVPVVTTPLPLAAGIVDRYGCGIVVPFGDGVAAAEAVLELREDPSRRAQMASAGREAVTTRYSWDDAGRLFVRQLEEWAAG